MNPNNLSNLEKDILRYYILHEYIDRYLPIEQSKGQVKGKKKIFDLGWRQKTKTWLEMTKTCMVVSIKTEQFALSERLTNAISNQRILNIIGPIKEEISNVTDYLENILLKEKLKEYQYSLEPTIMFFKAIGSVESLQDLSWYEEDFSVRLKKLQSCYSLDERMRCGVGIDMNEYQYC